MNTDIVLMKGETVVRQRNSEGCAVLECGCAHTPTHWLQMCKSHFDEDNALHVAAQERSNG